VPSPFAGGEISGHFGRPAPGIMLVEMMNATLNPPALSPTDRCDRCGARAYVIAVLPDGGQLCFCAHHGREHAERLREIAASIDDAEGVLKR
jgi:ribosomal protein L37E